MRCFLWPMYSLLWLVTEDRHSFESSEIRFCWSDEYFSHYIPGHLQSGKQRLCCPESNTVGLWHARGLPSVHCLFNQHFLPGHGVAKFMCYLTAWAETLITNEFMCYTHCSIATQLSARLRYSLRVKTATEISGWPYYFCSVLLTARTTGRLSTIWRLRATVFLRLQRSPLETVGCLWTAKRLRSAHVFPVEFFFPSRSILHADRDRERTPVEQTAEQAQSRRGFFQDLGSDSVIACFY